MIHENMKEVAEQNKVTAQETVRELKGEITARNIEARRANEDVLKSVGELQNNLAGTLRSILTTHDQPTIQKTRSDTATGENRESFAEVARTLSNDERRWNSIPRVKINDLESFNTNKHRAYDVDDLKTVYSYTIMSGNFGIIRR